MIGGHWNKVITKLDNGGHWNKITTLGGQQCILII